MGKAAEDAAAKIIGFKEYHHRSSAIPQAILTPELRITWHNEAFLHLFHLEQECTNTHIAGLTEFAGTDDRSLFHQLSDPATGFSFQGRGTSRFRHHPVLYTDIMIMPLLDENDPSKGVCGYCAYFHDVSREQRAQLQSIFSSLLEASLMKDHDTGRHIARVNDYSRRMAEHLYEAGTILEVSREFVENISFLAAMHDVGKIGIPDDILNKEGSLEAWEWEVMKGHTVNGAYILSSYPDPMAVEIARSHHERWDGSGYPYGLISEMIPLSARIVSIADVYDALRSRRSYKESMDHAQARDIVILGRGTQFDPELIDCFSEIEEDFEKIYREKRDITPRQVRPSREAD